MPNKMLCIGALALLTACSGSQPPAQPASRNDSGARAPEPSNFDPDDTQQERQDKAEARGAAEAQVAIEGDAANEERRKADGAADADGSRPASSSEAARR